MAEIIELGDAVTTRKIDDESEYLGCNIHAVDAMVPERKDDVLSRTDRHWC